ncbi:Na/Pi cotransporter family protein [Shinella sp.]|uniref:Na/Pi cotransporter family protein n=1 Tax=Shinella sp. TaxID=1870904 RepID=UPI002587028B|nr:Na/Pi cotransporter family protein [Shinella sp.]MCW5707405.1 Na/Pi cotransporter family protein [Shinella sp.]
MNFAYTLVGLAGTIALMLWGVRMVQTGVQRAFGARLRGFLRNALDNRIKAFLAGMGVTTVLQSSTATGLMVTGFAAGGLIGLVPALAVMLGANVGTTLIVQVLSFDVTAIAPALVLAGFVMFQRATAAPRDFGRVLIGLGLVLMSLHQFIALLEPYEHVSGLRALFSALTTQPVLAVVLAAALTWAAHSSVAVILLVMTFATQDMLSPQTALAFILGANLGTAINPVLEGATGDGLAGRRVPVGNLVNRLIGVVFGLALLEPISSLLTALEPNPARSVADFHTAFNLMSAVLFMPVLKPYAALLRRCMPDRADPADPSRPLYLDPAVREIPALALGGAAREALRMTDVLLDMLQGFRDALDKPDRRLISAIRRSDDILDRLNAAIKGYVVVLDSDALSQEDERRVSEILTFATNIEQAGDIVDRNLLALASKRMKRGLTFSREGKRELLELADTLIANTRQAASLFMTGDARAARMLAGEKEAFRQSEDEATTAHFDRLRSGQVETAETSALHLDLLRDMKQVNSHLVAAAAYPVLARNQELLTSRLSTAPSAN